MRLVTSVFALALAIVAIVMPGSVTGAATAAAAADATAATVSFAPAAAGTLAPGEDLVISGSVTNPTATPIAAGSASVLLNPSAVRSRSELTAWLNPTSTSATERLGTEVFSGATPAVPAGRTVPMQFTVPAAAINFGSQAAIWGARTLAVRITANGVQVGQARSSIVWNPGTGVQQTRLTVVMPLTVPESPDGLISSDLLTIYTASDGLLSRELDSVFDEPGVAIGIDPRIVASIRILGNSGPASAIAWLQRLQTATNDSFALSYADADLAAASQAKVTRVLAPTSFPVDARLFPGAPTRTPTPRPATTTTPTPTPTNQTIAPPTPTSGPVTPPVPDLQSLQAFDYTLPSVAWPAANSVVEADLTTFATSGLTTTILSSSNVGYGELDYTPSTAALIGTHPALVSDDGLSGYLQAAAAAASPSAWDQAMTNLSSAIAVISLERPATSRTLLATLDRTRPGGNARLTQTLAALATLPWSGFSSLKDANAAFSTGSTVPPTSASVVARPEPAARIATTAALLAAESSAGSFASILKDPSQITGERRLSLLALLSNAWSGDNAWNSATRSYIAKSTEYVTKSVTIARSSNAVITSRTSGLPITITNQLPWPVTVYVTVRSPSSILVINNDRVELTIEAQSQAKTTVPVTTNANGPVTLTVSLSSETNVPISTPTTIDVDVQAGWETAVTAVFAALLVAVFAFGIYRNIAKRRKAKRAGGIEPDESKPSRDAATTTPDA